MKKIVCFALSLLFICMATASCGENKPAVTATEAETTTAEVSTDEVTETEKAQETEEPAPLTLEEKLKDKTVLFVGDALFAGVSSDEAVSDGLVLRLAEKFAFKTVKTAAEDGASVSYIPGKTTVVSQLEAESNNKYDFVIIEGGVTDAAAAVDIGRIAPKSAEETDEKELDTGKFAGGFERTLITAKKLFPDASIGCFIAPKIKSGVGAVSDMRRFVEVMRLACEKWGVFVLDAYDSDIETEYSKNHGRTASTNINIYQGNGPENAIDGDMSTLFWANGGAYDGSTFTVDLSVLSEVSSVNLIMGSEKYPNNYMHSALLEYSFDGEEYTKLCDLNKTNRITYCDTKFTARYVRVRSTAYDVEWPLITEFEIEAEPSKDAGGEYEKPVRISGADLEKLTALISEFMGEIYGNKREPVFETQAGLCGVVAVLSGKKVLYYGDSVCDKSFHDDPTRTVYYSYAGRISEKYGTKTYNRGKDSASFSTTRGTNTIINQTKADLNRKVDMIVLEGGVNDAMDSAPVGVISDMTAENFDPDKLDKKTMAGGLEEVLYTLTENHKEAVIVYMILYKVDFSMGKCKEMDEYVDTIKALCDKWGVTYLDLYNDVWFNLRFNTKSRVYTNDGLHPNAAGYDFLTPVLAEFMADAYVSAKK